VVAIDEGLLDSQENRRESSAYYNINMLEGAWYAEEHETSRTRETCQGTNRITKEERQESHRNIKERRSEAKGKNEK
jgi:hypothetical protein